MGRPPRVLIAGGIYHVYNRVARGTQVFCDEAEAEKFEGLVAATKKRDEFQILAWCLMSNHYHLAVRMGEVSLSRSIRFIQHRYSQSYNGRHGVFGPVWQGRFRSKFVDDEGYLRQLISYIHLNPITAGVVNDAAKYRWCGHRELVGRGVGRRLVNVDETLMAFGVTRKSALAAYRSAMSTTLREDWRREGPGRLPWWRVGRSPKRESEEELTVDATRPRIGMDGRSNVALRPRMDVDDFLDVGAGALEISVADLRSRKRVRPVVEGREILAWVGVELYGFTVKQMAEAMAKRLETTSRLVSRAAWRRVERQDFRQKIQDVDSYIVSARESRKGR